MASRSSALTIASFLAFSSSSLSLIDPEARLADVFSFVSVVSPLGMLVIDNGSLASLFNIEVEVDLSNAIMPLGPRDMLRRCFSVSFERTLSRVLTDLIGTVRFVEEPGLGLGFPAASGFFNLALADGDAMVGPPSLRFIESHCSGSLAEKLQKY